MARVETAVFKEINVILLRELTWHNRRLLRFYLGLYNQCLTIYKLYIPYLLRHMLHISCSKDNGVRTSV